MLAHGEMITLVKSCALLAHAQHAIITRKCTGGDLQDTACRQIRMQVSYLEVKQTTVVRSCIRLSASFDFKLHHCPKFADVEVTKI